MAWSNKGSLLPGDMRGLLYFEAWKDTLEPLSYEGLYIKANLLTVKAPLGPGTHNEGA
jgi:hypothetical protein